MLLIRSVQVELNNMGAVIMALPHLARPSDRTAKEVLSFVCIMLFNANEDIQVHARFPLLSNRPYLSRDACLEVKREDNWNCSVLCCVRQLCTMIRTQM